MRVVQIGVLVLAGLTVLIAGCPHDVFPGAAPATLDDANRIINNTDLTINERRQQLAALGFSDDTINVLLRDQRTGNQGGGDLRSAQAKVAGDQLATMTPDEVQVYADEVGNVDQNTSVTINDLAAADLVRWWQDNDIFARSDLDEALKDPAISVTFPSSLNPDDVRAVFVTFDPARLIDRIQ